MMERSKSSMMLPWESIGHKLSAVSFIVLFPLFFLYHFAVGKGIIPPIFGGWFGIMSLFIAVVFIPFGVYCLFRFTNTAFWWFSIVFALFFLVLWWLFVHYLFGASYQTQLEVVVQVGSMLIAWFALFMIGLYWPKNLPAFSLILWMIFVLMAAIIVTHTDWTYLMFYARHVFGNDNIASYQGFARSLAFTGLALLGMTAHPVLRNFLVITLIILLFLTGARSEFYGFLLVLPLVFWVGFKRKKPKWLVAVVTVVTALFLIAIIAINLSHLDFLTSSRQLEILDLSKSTSFQGRKELLVSGLAGIGRSPIMGDYAGYVRDHGTTGAYIHNALSTWQQFGLVGFLIYLGLNAGSFYVPFKRVVIHRYYYDCTAVTALYISAFCLVLILTAKSVFWASAALPWGLATSICASSNQFHLQKGNDVAVKNK